MGGKRKSDCIDNNVIEHIKSSILISSSDTCHSCPLRIYSKSNDTVTFGIGNINSNYIFILPTYDTKAKVGYNKLLDLLVEAYKEITNNNIYEEVYITRLVKCYSSSEHNLYSQAIKPCSQFLNYEVIRLKSKNVVFFGDSYNDYINNNKTVGGYISRKTIHNVYNPGVLYYDNQKLKDTFIQQLTAVLNHN